MKNNFRPSKFDGQFYSSDSVKLKNDIDVFFSLLKKDERLENKIKAIIVPHASYYYSGLTASWAYKNLINQRINRVILLGDSHTSIFPGLALSDYDAWETPLGKIKVDLDFINKIKTELLFSKIDNLVFANDHIFEVQLPFLQKINNFNFSIIPLSLGEFKEEYFLKIVNFLKNNIKSDDLLIISSDLSHYPHGSDAEKIDKKSLELISQKNIKALEDHINNTLKANITNEETLICSFNAIKILMLLAKDLEWSALVLNYSHSGEVSGDNDQVVGYGALAFY